MSCVPLEQGTAASQTAAEYYSDKTLHTDNHVYLEHVRLVQMYTETDNPEEIFNPPLVPLSQQQPVILEFDLVQPEQIRCSVKLVYCNADWTPSGLVDMQFLEEYNQFYITDYNASTGTRTGYWHYRFQVPRVKLPGNYLAVVTGPGGDTDYLLTRRLLVYAERVSVGMQVGFAAGAAARFVNQQVDFSVNYPDYPLVNPQQTVKVVLRQNFRWDNAKYNLTPTILREDIQRLEYTFFTGENSFPAGNEYRAFDIRTIRSLGLGIGRIRTDTTQYVVELAPEKSRKNDVYSQQFDINGMYFIGQREYGNGDVNGEYVLVKFTLRAPEQEGTVYIFGGLTDWQLDKRYRCTYDAAKGIYTATAFLKQGYYNYAYVIKPNAGTAAIDETTLEGSHNITENKYDVLVYYRPPGTRADLLVGYKRTSYFGRDGRSGR